MSACRAWCLYVKGLVSHGKVFGQLVSLDERFGILRRRACCFQVKGVVSLCGGLGVSVGRVSCLMVKGLVFL